jgi:hypothetical protein
MGKKRGGVQGHEIARVERMTAIEATHTTRNIKKKKGSKGTDASGNKEGKKKRFSKVSQDVGFRV